MTNILTRKKLNSGFTLLEVIISLGLIATALVAIFQLQAVNLDLQAEARFITIANLLARDRMSKIEAMDILSEGTETGDLGEEYEGFSFREEIYRVPDRAHLFKVSVSIILEGTGSARDFSHDTYMYRYQTL